MGQPSCHKHGVPFGFDCSICDKEYNFEIEIENMHIHCLGLLNNLDVPTDLIWQMLAMYDKTRSAVEAEAFETAKTLITAFWEKNNA